jgi:hypothetical protein
MDMELDGPKIAVLFGSLVAIVGSFYWTLRSNQKYLQPLIPELGGKIRVQFFSWRIYLNTVFERSPVRIGIQPGVKYSFPTLWIQMRRSSGLRFFIVRRGVPIALWYRLLYRALKTGDGPFDERYDVWARDPGAVQRMLGESRKREEIELLFAHRFSVLFVGPTHLLAIKPYRTVGTGIFDVLTGFNIAVNLTVFPRPKPALEVKGAMKDELNGPMIKTYLSLMQAIKRG